MRLPAGSKIDQNSEENLKSLVPYTKSIKHLNFRAKNIYFLFISQIMDQHTQHRKLTGALRRRNVNKELYYADNLVSNPLPIYYEPFWIDLQAYRLKLQKLEHLAKMFRCQVI